MKTFKSFIQLDEAERVKYKDGIANKMAYASDEVKTKGNRLDNKQPFGEEVPSHQAKTTMKHINNPNAAEKKAAKDIKPGIAGVRDRLAMLQAAKDRGALKNEEVLSHDEEAEPPRGTGERLAAAKRKQAAQKAAKDAQKARDKAFDDYMKKGMEVKNRGRDEPPPQEKRGSGNAGANARIAARKAAAAEAERKSIAARKAAAAEAERKSKMSEANVELLSNLYDRLDESNQEIFLTQLEEDVEVLLAFAKTMMEE